MQFIDLARQYSVIKTKIRVRVNNVLEHGQYISGPEVAEFEQKIADYVGVQHAISCANGTDALQLALIAEHIGPGDAVFTTPFTFFATAEAISIVGATPIFVDIDLDTYNLCPLALESAISKVAGRTDLRPKAVIPVDLFGLPANYPEILPIAEKFGLTVIADAAQGFGGQIGERRAGAFGKVATTSFFPAKPLGCYGDGGALFTNDDDLALVLKSLRIHGKGDDKYDNVRIGMNSRLDTLQAAILDEKLLIFPKEMIERQRVANRYRANLNDAVGLPYVPEGYISSWAQFTVRVRPEQREAIMAGMKSCGIPTVIYYPRPLHLQSAYLDLAYEKGSFPQAELASESVMSLPMHPYLTNEEVDRISDSLRKVLGTF